jgi:hypothetical protein
MTDIKAAKAIMALFSMAGIVVLAYAIVSDPVDVAILLGAVVALVAFFWAFLVLHGEN